MQDYKNEVKAFFASNEQLAAEVEFILKSAEKEPELEEQMVNCSLAEQKKSTAVAEVSTLRRRSRSMKSITFRDKGHTPYVQNLDRKIVILFHRFESCLRNNPLFTKTSPPCGQTHSAVVQLEL